MKYTVLRTVDLRRVVVPNLILILYPVRTYESEESVRYAIRCTVQYTSDISQVKQAIAQGLKKVPIINQQDASKILLENM
jgi:small-conductance mechanosensitive channel